MNNRDGRMSNVDAWIRHGSEMRRPLLVADDMSTSEKIVIVGGGLSGLCCAYRIAKKRPDIHVFLIEKAPHLGGVISTWKSGEWVCDLAVNATRPHPAFWRLVADLGLSSQFHASRSRAKSRWVLLNGKKHRLSFLSLFKIGALKLRKGIKVARHGGASVSQLLPHRKIADAMTLGIVNDTSQNVDADFLMPAMTRFGDQPPMKASLLKKKINRSYPLFTPKTGTVASLDGGMQTLVDALEQQLESMDNVSMTTGQEIESPQAAADMFDVPLYSVIWSAPGMIGKHESTELSVFAVGYREADVAKIPYGYGTLIPDPSVPFSGILHESDLHHSQRAPEGHRLFRIMAPHSRWDGDESKIRDALKHHLGDCEPVLFENLGKRKIPCYPPGYMQNVAKQQFEFNCVGWGVSGVSITHVVDEAERICEKF